MVILGDYEQSLVCPLPLLEVPIVEPPIKDIPNKGHNRNNLRTKDKFQCTK